ncbi:unnamed protein product [Allacma fusca]|uniref:Uncharacterized protein n=1 Tax=Allacma fusca TaxID=39272 RepID=A0A8J2J6F0_9HEXA|nr:unnamed protein product [Allacma fusca]
MIFLQFESYYSFYDRIINGYEPNRRRDKPFIEVIPKFEYKGTRTINLKLFLERYSGIFKIKDSFSSNTSIQNFGKNSDIPLINWQSCKSTNPINDTELKESRTQSFFTNITAEIQGMIQNPMVRLFSGENLTGASEKIHSGRARQQFNIYASCTGTTTAANVKSAETFGKTEKPN